MPQSKSAQVLPPAGRLAPLAEWLRHIELLLRGDASSLRLWCDRRETLPLCLVAILAGSGLYGGAMGCWRAPAQGLFVAIKFPLIILLTTLGNALLNAMLAPLLGLNLAFRKSFLVVLMSYAITSAILGSFSPLAAFMVWNAPPMSASGGSAGVYGSLMLTHVAVIAFAGTVGNVRLGRLLCELGGNSSTARRVLLAWLAGNLFLGSQLSWILRPFIGSPALPVEFLRADAFKGSFYETVWRVLLHVLSHW